MRQQAVLSDELVDAAEELQSSISVFKLAAPTTTARMERINWSLRTMRLRRIKTRLGLNPGQAMTYIT